MQQHSYPFFSRRSFLAGSSATAMLAASRPFTLPAEDKPLEFAAGKAEHCLMIWLGGGACQIDTWDPKEMGDPKAGKAGSYYKAIDTVVDGVQVSEHLASSAAILDRYNILRTVHHEVIDEHAIATNRMHTGRPTSGTVMYPSIGSLVSHHRGAVDPAVPPYVLIGYPNVTRGPGFLGPQAGYVYLTDTSKGPVGISRPENLTDSRQRRRTDLLRQLRKRFLNENPGKQVRDYDLAISQALDLSGPGFRTAFQLEKEPDSRRQAYGSEFGQRCLLARRLVQRGVRFVEISHNLNFVNGTGWDTHNDGQLKQHLLIRQLDKALAALVTDLEQQNLLDKTLVVVSTEFGRPASFDSGGGRGHHSRCFSVVMAGGGLRTGQAIGVSDELGMKILEQPISVPDLHATIHYAMGIHPGTMVYDGDRPVPTTDGGMPIRQLFS